MLKTPLYRLLVILVVAVLFIPFTVAQSPATPATSSSSIGILFAYPRLPLGLPDGTKTAELVNGAIVVDYPLPGGPAAAAGVANGDIVLALNGHRMCAPDQMAQAVRALSPGSDAELILFRDGSFRPMKVRVSTWDAVYPSSATLTPLAAQIDEAAKVNNYKLARELCKRIPDELQFEASFSCIDAYRVRYDYKEFRKAIEGISVRCRNCAKSLYARAWLTSPTSNEGIQAGAAITKAMAQFRQSQFDLFRKMDRDLANSIAGAEPSQALAKYTQYARLEGACRDVPPSAPLVGAMLQFARQNGNSVSEAANAKAEDARKLEKSARNGSEIEAAARTWNETLWQAPWWSEPYMRNSALLDKLGRPAEAAEVGKMALLIPAAASAAAPVTVSKANPAADNEPASEQSLAKCTSALDATEKGSDAERDTRLRCARIAGRLTSKPEIPETARRHSARGEAALELGQSPAEFMDAAMEFEGALRLAPGWAEAHCNLGSAYEKASKLQDAIFAYQGCLAAAPNAPNVADTQKRIYKLEYAADREQKQAISAQMQQRESAIRLQSMVGAWFNKDSGNLYSAIIKDGLFIATRTPPSDRYTKYQGNYVLKGAIKGDTIEGTWTDPPVYTPKDGCTTPVSEMPMSGTISRDGKTMTVKYMSANYQTHGVPPNLFNVGKCTLIQKVGDQTVMMILQKKE